MTSSALPRWHSLSIIDLYSAVNDPDSHGNPVLQAPSEPPQQLFPHDLLFRDSITHLKADNIFQVGFCNIGGFPALPPPNDKAQELKTSMALYDIDILRGSEANLNWSKLPENIRLSEWFRDIPLCQTFTACNSTENLTRHQFGRTFWIGIGQATWYIASSSRDPSGLGRWSVCTLLSRTSRKLHIIFTYRPCKNSRSKLQSIYAQHHHFLDSSHCYICPRSAFLLDLSQAIAKWTHQGDEVMLLVNVNGI